ncbi:MAG TPA: winged helix-turn-helix domain-containing protein [Pyrinomonadaceae bacterium]
MTGEGQDVFEFGPFYLDAARRRLLRGGRPVRLTAKAFDVLLLLVRNVGEVVAKETFMRAVWPDSFVEDSNLTVSISMLRKTLGDSYSEHRYIETVSGRGYRFVARVQRVPGGGSHSVGPPLSVLGTTAEDFRSLAVLPLTNVGQDQLLEIVGDGITESLINSLSQLHRLRIFARETAFHYREADPRAAGHALGAHTVLAGEVRRSDGTLVISVELIEVAGGERIWSAQYACPLSALPAAQAEIATSVAGALRLKITGEEKLRLLKRYTENTEAYNLYLKGRYFWNKYAAKWVKKGIGYFEQAIEIDRSYALAYAGVADCYFRLSAVHLPPPEALPKASAAAHRAVALDDSLAEAHASLAMIKFWYDYDWAGAEHEFRRALELNPGASLAHQRYGEYLMFTERFDEALAELRLAQSLDPLSLWIGVSLGTNLFLMGRYEQAIEQVMKVLEMDPHYYPARFCLGMIRLRQGRLAEAVAEFQKARQAEEDSSFALGFIGYAHGIAGQQEEAAQALRTLLEQSSTGYVSPYGVALINLGLSDFERTFEWLEKLYESRDEWTLWLRVAPELKGLRSDARFVSLMERIGFDKCHRSPRETSR